jgi:hypothetical protein
VDLGEINGKRDRHSFKTKQEAEAFAEQARVKKQNEGLAAFNLPNEIRADALRASDLLKPHGVSIHQAVLEFVNARKFLGGSNVPLSQVAQDYAKAQMVIGQHGVSLSEVIQYYDKHVLKYRDAPVISKIVEQMLKDAEANSRRDRTVQDLRNRLNSFAVDFGAKRLTDLGVEEVKEWITDEEWAAQTRINYLTKISQLFNYGIKHGWAEVNLAAESTVLTWRTVSHRSSRSIKRKSFWWSRSTSASAPISLSASLRDCVLLS